MVKISVIIPVYNSEKYLEKCLKSVIYQTYENLEIICVNDGSEDNSLNILEDFKKKDERVKIISTENKGQSHARNKGLKESSGDYVSFIDSDDWVSLSLYEKFIYALNNSEGFEIFLFNARKVYSNPKNPFYEEFFKPYEWKNYENENNILNFDYCMNPFEGNMSAVNKIYERKFLDKNGIEFIEGLIFEDQLFYIQTMLEAKKIYMYKECLYNYRINEFSTMQNAGKRVFDIFKITDKIKELISKQGRFEEFKYALLQHEFLQFSYLLFQTPDNKRKDFYNEAKIRLQNFKNLDKNIIERLRGYQIFYDIVALEYNDFIEKYKDKVIK